MNRFWERKRERKGIIKYLSLLLLELLELSDALRAKSSD